MFSCHFFNPFIISLIDTMNEIGDCNDPGYFFISLNYIFCRLVNLKPSRLEVPWSNSTPIFVKLSLPSSVFMLILCM